MKTKLVITALLLFAVIFGFKNPSEETRIISDSPPSPDNQFLITAMHAGEVDSNYIHIPDLGINAWHKYTGPEWGWPGIQNDHFNQPTSAYSNAVIQRINDNKNFGLRSIMDRPKIEYLVFGQKSEYQCEDVSKVDPNFWYYTYGEHYAGSDTLDNSQFGNNQWVRFCDADPDNPGSNAGYVVKKLKANREQANRYWPPWIADSACKWYVMPNIRVESSIVTTDPNRKVCAIIIKDWDGNTIDSVDIFAKCFKKINGNYNGSYLEEFYFLQTPDEISSAIKIPAGAICPGPRKNLGQWEIDNIKTDFRVYWYGQCDMWIDYVKVENQSAHELFKGIWDQQIREETDIAMSNYDPANPIPNNFYIEEFEFNIVDAMKHVNTIIKQQSNEKLSLMVNLNYPLFRAHIPFVQNEFSASQINEYLVSKAGIKYLVNMSYPLEGFEGSLFPVQDNGTSAHPITLSPSDYSVSTGVLSYPKTPSDYENWLQSKLDIGRGAGEGFMKVIKKTDSISRYYSPGIKLIHLEQAHSWFSNWHKLKEPSNEEMSLMANLSISYGAKGIMYFAYDSHNSNFDTTNGKDYARGLTNPDGSPRYSSVYGQDKWNGVKKINNILSKWGPYLLNFKQEKRKSYAYHLPDERNALIYGGNGHFVNEIFSYKPESNGNISNTPDPINERYIQAAFFDSYSHLDPPPNPPERYFMIVNRRCSPYIDSSSSDNIGGKRFIKMSIHPFSLWFKKYRNVSLQDLSDNSIDTTFYNEDNINYDMTLNLGWFNPGEAKLFRLAPALCVGGSLVADEEDIRNIEFTCDGQVNTNGRTVWIGDTTTINFTPYGRITANGGTLLFYSDYYPAFYPAVILKGLNGQLWGGVSVNNCEAVFINTVFENTTGQAIYSINSNLYLENCSFNITSRAIQYSNTGSSTLDAYIKNCKFNINNTSATQCNLIGNAGGMVNLFIDGNEFNTSSGSIALNINSGFGNIKNNKINQYTYGMYLSNSTTDIYNNVIYSGQNNSRGISAVAMSRINLGIDGQGNITGGMDSINLSGQNANDIYVSNSTFNIHRGYNNFNVNSSGSFHLTGTFPQSNTRDYPTIYARNNCFNFSNTHNNAIHSVFWENSNNTQVSFFLTPYSCDKTVEEEVETVADLGHGFTDTIKKAVNIESENSSTEQSLYDSLSLDLRTLDFQNASGTAKTLISLYADNANANEIVLDAVTKLYSSVLSVDSANNSTIEQLKTFFETMILDHPDNSELIAKIFYYIQKCKVILEDYVSSINGFQQIIDSDPYSYEALVASWDIDATRLLDSTSGNGGGESNSELTEEALKKKYSVDDPNDRYDTKKFTKEDRKLIRENVYNSQKTIREINTENFKKLEKKISEGEATKNEKKEYENKKVLKETAKPKNPGTIEEHINNVSNDLSKVLGIGNEGSVNDKISSMNPYEYNLSQNYPNPFNPVTRLEFGIPKLGYVSLKVYDILGREIKTLVNEIRPVGIYKIEFDGTNFASGVYFYRIEAGDFVQTKRMVLIK